MAFFKRGTYPSRYTLGRTDDTVWEAVGSPSGVPAGFFVFHTSPALAKAILRAWLDTVYGGSEAVSLAAMAGVNPDR